MRLTLGITGLYFGAKIYVLISFNSFSLFFDGFNCKDVTYHNPLYLGTLQARSSVNPSVLIKGLQETNHAMCYFMNRTKEQFIWFGLQARGFLISTFISRQIVSLFYNTTYIEDFFIFELWYIGLIPLV